MVVIRIVVMIVVDMVIMIVMMIVMLLALHIDAAMKIAVRLVDHRRADRGLRIAERDGKRIVALHNLRQPRDVETPEGQRQQNGDHEARKCELHHTRFRLRSRPATARQAPVYTTPYASTATMTPASTPPQPWIRRWRISPSFSA